MQRSASVSSPSAAGGAGGSGSNTTPRALVSISSRGGMGGLPPPPNLMNASSSAGGGSATAGSLSPSYSKAIAKSMTIEEMRQLHQRALSEAEAKRTELRLVLASRYRELVGSSDEVLRMRERAQELHHLVNALPQLIHKLLADNNNNNSNNNEKQQEEQDESKSADVDCDNNNNSTDMTTTTTTTTTSTSDEQLTLILLRRELSRLPRVVHRALDQQNVFMAASSLVQVLSLIASCTNAYPLATALAKNAPTATNTNVITPSNSSMDPLLEAQMRLIFYHIQTLPAKTIRMARHTLLQSSSYGPPNVNPNVGAWPSAQALSALLLLHVPATATTLDSTITNSGNMARSAWWLDLYFDSKATLLQSLLQQLGNYDSSNSSSNTTTNSFNNSNITTTTTTNTTNTAEDILSKIVMILQYDIILHAYQIFCLRRLPIDQTIGTTNNNNKSTSAVMTMTTFMDLTELQLTMFQSLPTVDPDLVKAKSSRLLASYLPLIRNKVKSVLVSIAGTTASALGQIRQSLYDKTDGMDCKVRLDANFGVCTWEQAVQGMVNVHTVLRSQDGVGVVSSSSTGGSRSTTEQLFATTESGALTMTGAAGGSAAGIGSSARKFSLWSALFSNTFSSLVHSLLTTSFHSVHAHVVSTLRTSVANAPPFTVLLPHEAYRNTLKIASDLNAALLKVSDDAHNLLVHAEERDESERRLRQSLYVQTCEIMGRLLNELRRMLQPTTTTTSNSTSNNNTSGNQASAAAAAAAAANTTKQLIVGRLCHLLKFRLASLSTLLHPSCSPAALTSAAASNAATGASSSGGVTSSSTTTTSTGTTATTSSGGMITWLELKSAFDLADDNDDGLITFDEAMEAVDSAFSGTPFHGAEMVRETLLLSSSTSTATTNDPEATSTTATPRTVTLEELALLSARGLRHDVNGPLSALGIIQTSLDAMVERCFHEWARVALTSATDSLAGSFQDFAQTACTIPSDAEWQRRYGWNNNNNNNDNISTLTTSAELVGDMEPLIGNVSPHAVGYLLELSSLLNRSVCPSDSLPPVPSTEYASSLGISINNSKKDKDSIPTMMETIRWSLLRQGLTGVVRVLEDEVVPPCSPEEEDKGVLAWKNSCPSALLQLQVDVSFFRLCLLERNCHGYYYPDGGAPALSISSVDIAKERLAQVSDMVQAQAMNSVPIPIASSLEKVVADRHQHILEVCDMFVSSLLGESSAATGGTLLAEHDWSAVATTATAGIPQLLLHNPLPSSRRFGLLPIQADRSLADVIARGKFGKKEEESDQRTESVGGVMSSGLGFFSSMLKKK